MNKPVPKTGLSYGRHLVGKISDICCNWMFVDDTTATEFFY